MGEQDTPLRINPAGEVPQDTEKLLAAATQTSEGLWQSAFCPEGANSPVCGPGLSKDSVGDGYPVSLPLLALTTMDNHMGAFAELDGKEGISKADLQQMLERTPPGSALHDMTQFALKNFESIRDADAPTNRPTEPGDSPDITAADLKASQAKYLELIKGSNLLVEADFVQQHWDAFSAVFNGKVTAEGLQALNTASPYQPALKALQEWAGPNRVITKEDIDGLVRGGEKRYAEFGVSLDDLRRTFAAR